MGKLLIPHSAGVDTHLSVFMKQKPRTTARIETSRAPSRTPGCITRRNTLRACSSRTGSRDALNAGVRRNGPTGSRDRPRVAWIASGQLAKSPANARTRPAQPLQCAQWRCPSSSNPDRFRHPPGQAVALAVTRQIHPHRHERQQCRTHTDHSPMRRGEVCTAQDSAVNLRCITSPTRAG